MVKVSEKNQCWKIFARTSLRPCYTKQFFLQLATHLSICRGGVTRLQLFSQLATRIITNKKADASWNLPQAKDELWLAHSDKIALQVAEGMSHTSNLSRNVAKSRGSVYFSCNSQRNNWSCKMGCCNLQRNVCCVASCKKIASCNMAFKEAKGFRRLERVLSCTQSTHAISKLHASAEWIRIRERREEKIDPDANAKGKTLPIWFWLLFLYPVGRSKGKISPFHNTSGWKPVVSHA